MESKTLIVYFSQSGQTEKIAGLLAKVTCFETEPITAASPYKGDAFAIKERVRQETKTNLKVNINPLTHDVTRYGTIILGMPIWNGSIPGPMLTFIKNVDWRGIKVFPFFSSGGVYTKIYSELMGLLKGAVIADPMYLIYDLNGRFLGMIE